ncbi:SurA N-terminal domain-containing protein [Streptomyces sp. NBC_00454]|uniref:SurA N-terminal domain-containing protein n=1 Tax=Streptomyces sp. NBC_00454 TaxID=2975747 RepID=UPI0030E13103
MHRRTALSVSAALLLAAPLLSACSGQARPGTAAVIGGERITTSAVQAQVNDVRAAQNRSEHPSELIAAVPQLDRVKLSGMLQSRILDRMAEDAGISVTPKELEEERQTFENDKGAEAFEATLLQKFAIAPDQIDRWATDQVLFTKLNAKYGQGNLAEPASKAAGKLGIEVNPRYGVWDPQKVSIGDSVTPWITQVTRPEQQPPAGA